MRLLGVVVPCPCVVGVGDLRVCSGRLVTALKVDYVSVGDVRGIMGLGLRPIDECVRLGVGLDVDVLDDAALDVVVALGLPGALVGVLAALADGRCLVDAVVLVWLLSIRMVLGGTVLLCETLVGLLICRLLSTS